MALFSSLPHPFEHVHPSTFPNVLVTNGTKNQSSLGFMLHASPVFAPYPPLCSTLPTRRIESLTLNLISWSVASGDTTACSAAGMPVGSRAKGNWVACKITAYKAADTAVQCRRGRLSHSEPLPKPRLGASGDAAKTTHGCELSATAWDFCLCHCLLI